MIHDKYIYNIYIYIDSMLDVCCSIYVLGVRYLLLHQLLLLLNSCIYTINYGKQFWS